MISGNKLTKITVLYTPWSNLKKTAGMETGQVTFHKQNLVKKVFLLDRDNKVLNRLNKTKQERNPDLAAEKIEKQRLERDAQRLVEKRKKQEDLALTEERKRLAEQRDYKNLVQESAMTSNKTKDKQKGFKAYEEDFM